MSDHKLQPGGSFFAATSPLIVRANVYFLTIYPGWYQGRAVHIHVKVRTFDGPSESYEFTSQFSMDEAFTDEVYKLAPYSTRGSRDTRNSNDGIYNGTSDLGGTTGNSGSQLMLVTRNKGSWVEADARLILDTRLGSSPRSASGRRRRRFSRSNARWTGRSRWYAAWWHTSGWYASCTRQLI